MQSFHSHLVRLAGLSIAAALLVTSAGLATSNAATPKTMYSAVGDFSLRSNPNGLWSYRANGTLLTHRLSACATQVICWWNGNPVCNAVAVGKNVGRTPVNFGNTVVQPADHLRLDPESIASAGVYWTAPVAGTYKIAGDFMGIDTSERPHGVAIMDNGKAIYTRVVAVYRQTLPFQLTRKLARGERIKFLSTTASQCTYLSTGLKANITKI